LLLAAPFALFLAFWAILAVRRAAQTDPQRPRREARARLVKLLGAQSSSLTPQRLLQWQRDTAVLWRLNHAAPRASAIPDATWATLWTETDRSLYGAQVALPSDWTARAQAALAAHRVPGFQPLRLFLARNLFPFAAVLAVFLGAGAVWLRAAVAIAPDAATAYRRGDFAAAEKSWRAAVNRTPTDWIARHNLSLALAQQGRATDAAAWAASAFVQNPGHAAVRWQFRHGSEQTGAAPGPLLAFVAPDALRTLAEHHSPAQWQVFAIAAAVLAALALGTILANAYGRRARIVFAPALVIFLLALGAIGGSFAGLLAYGAAADARAVVVARASTLRSLPTEADTQQKTTPLAAGSLALADRAFLNDRWTRLAFANGQTGWVRTEDLVALWRWGRRTGRRIMPLSATLAAPAELTPWREHYRRETPGQIVHDSLHRRPGWTQSHLLKIDAVAVGYGSVALAGPWAGKPTVFEFFVAPEHRVSAFALFEAFLAASGARNFEVQTNDTLLTVMLHAYARDIVSEKIVFRDHAQTALPSRGASLRQVTSNDELRAFTLNRQGCAEWALDRGGEMVATGGLCFHYHAPWCDLFYDVPEPQRRRGFGSYLVQELKRTAYALGATPAARCNPDNLASRQTLQKAGLVPCGHILLGTLK
ncbi:MAG: GNAT family N-acetyltransferase, partial [Opitutaceae bacterium]|nr:GNAT family N-acetyltransferase [Opitutaceae bacterium]